MNFLMNIHRMVWYIVLYHFIQSIDNDVADYLLGDKVFSHWVYQHLHFSTHIVPIIFFARATHIEPSDLCSRAAACIL